MLDGYLNQKATLKKAAKASDGSPKMNNRGEIEFLAPVTISCRKQVRTQTILTSDARVLKTDYIYYTSWPVWTDDLLDGQRVQDVAEWADLTGEIVGYKAVV